ncbi:hypothetical protein D9758_015614 [Tetrapyrgos nigripes]|uniref:Carboxylic ester hydrolase n=1 Tax=Tetrapyrgos nigripes TaxID=182062 RepID=A0A8H5CML3_9AGAR|nr:hypothetical protein D9758_015614 [Tetrapyrgos nigripes]
MKSLLLSILCFFPALPLHIASAAYTPAQYSTDSPNNSDDPLIVDLGYAKYQGVLNETSNNVRFLGVRYAKSTAGQLRWKTPQAPDPLSDSKSKVQVLVADKQPAECPQAAGGLAPSSPFRTENASTGLNANKPELLKRDEGDNVPTEDEDCLFLNVFVPESQFNKTNTDCEEDEEFLPVIVWIHGGGYHAGSASNPSLPNTTGTYNGEDLLNHLRADGDNRAGAGAVVVVIQYRLGLFGFLAGKEVGAEGDLNVGLLDQQFALQWVQQHIYKFGGDPLRVVIWGESAGAGSVLNHLIANGGKTTPPLFHGAILSSIYLPPVYEWNDEIPEAIYTEVVSQTNCSDATDTITCLRKADFDVLSAVNNQVAAEGFFGTFMYSPVVDGKLITRRPTQLMKEGRINKVQRILATSNSNEGVIFTDPNATDVKDFVMNLFPTLEEDTASEAVALYANANPALSVFDAAAQIYGESMFICPPYFLIEAKPNGSYKGRFAITPALHGDDLFYSFTSLSRPSPPLFQNPAFQKAFSQSFLAFATSKDSNPNDKFDPTSILPQWPLWDSRNTSEMLFNRTEDFQPVIKAMKSDEGLLDRCR